MKVKTVFKNNTLLIYIVMLKEKKEPPESRGHWVLFHNEDNGKMVHLSFSCASLHLRTYNLGFNVKMQSRDMCWKISGMLGVKVSSIMLFNNYLKCSF